MEALQFRQSNIAFLCQSFEKEIIQTLVAEWREDFRRSERSKHIVALDDAPLINCNAFRLTPIYVFPTTCPLLFWVFRVRTLHKSSPVTQTTLTRCLVPICFIKRCCTALLHTRVRARLYNHRTDSVSDIRCSRRNQPSLRSSCHNGESRQRHPQFPHHRTVHA